LPGEQQEDEEICMMDERGIRSLGREYFDGGVAIRGMAVREFGSADAKAPKVHGQSMWHSPDHLWWHPDTQK